MLTKKDIGWLEDSFLPKLAEKVRSDLKESLDSISIKLDKFVGDIKAKREEQTLHTGDHQRIDRLEKHTKLMPLADQILHPRD